MNGEEGFRLTNHTFDRWAERFGTGFDEMLLSLTRSDRIPFSKMLSILQSRKKPGFKIRDATEYWHDEAVGALFIVNTVNPPDKIVVTVIKFEK